MKGLFDTILKFVNDAFLENDSVSLQSQEIRWF